MKIINRQQFAEYRYGAKGVVREGQRFRVSGGPYYTTADGKKILMADRGVFIFLRYCVTGRRRWIEATRPHSVTTERLPVSRTKATIDGYTMRPYSIRAMRRKVKA